MRYIKPLRAWQGNILPYWLMSRQEVSPSAKILYARLCGYCGEREFCWPTKETLAKELGLTSRQIRRLINELEKIGLIEVRRVGSNFRYYLLEHPWQAGEMPNSTAVRNKRRKAPPVEQLGFPSMLEDSPGQLPARCTSPTLQPCLGVASCNDQACPDLASSPPDLVSLPPTEPSDVSFRASDVSVPNSGKPASEPLYLGRDSSKRLTEEKKNAAQAPLGAASPAPVLVLVSGDECGEKPKKVPEREVKTLADRLRAQVLEVWTRYLELHGQHVKASVKPKLTATRASHITRRIREYGLEAVLRGVELLWQDQWRRERGYTAIEYVVRSAEQLEKILSAAPGQVSGNAAPGQVSGNRRHGNVWVQGADASLDCTRSKNGWTAGQDGQWYDCDGNVAQSWMTEEEIRASVPASAVPMYLEQLAQQKAMAAGARP
jgi:hypothetical protein